MLIERTQPLLPTLPPRVDLAELARNATYGPRLATLADEVYQAVPDMSWSPLSRSELEVIRLLDGVTPVAMLGSMTYLPVDELHAAIAMLLARGFIVESDDLIIPLSLRDVVLVDGLDAIDGGVQTISVVPAMTTAGVEERIAE